MQLSDLNATTIGIAIGVLLLLLGVYSSVMSAIKTMREENARKAQPVNDLTTLVRKHAEMLASDKRRIERLEADAQDMRNGQRATIKGIQALLDHELHNGNADQMQSASS